MELSIEINALTRVYADRTGASGAGRVALDSVGLSAVPGEFVALVGRSGSGKTTLLNIVGGLDRDWTGKVRVLGRDTGGMPDRELSALRNSGIGFVFQAFHLLSHLTVLQNVMLPWHFSSSPKGAAVARAVELLDGFGLGDRADSFPWQLSAGERQRVAIARAMLNKPAILLCDEPTGNLDAVTGEKVLDIFKAIRATRETTILVATHDERIAACADRIVKLDDGRCA